MTADRRQFLRLATVSGAIGLIGCIGRDGDPETGRVDAGDDAERESADETASESTGEGPTDEGPTDEGPTGESPVLRDVSLETADVRDGTTLRLIVLAESNTTVNWLHISLEGPNGNIRGGGQGWDFEEVEDGVWKTEWTYTVSDEAASGEYSFSRVHVENEANLESAPWPAEPSATIRTDADPERPVLSDVSLEPVDVSSGTELRLTVLAESNVPVNWLHISLEGPNGNIRGGGQGWEFTEIEDGTWETVWTYTVSDEAASGEYSFSRVHVENEGGLESAPWAEEPSVTIETDVNPEEPTLEEVSLEAVDVRDGTELRLTVLAESNITVNWLHISLEGPNGNIRGGGQGWEFTEVDQDLWETVWTYTVSDEAASGEYSFSRIHVENEANLESAPWPDKPSVTLDNS
ncbi:hypothetical protein [Halosolutus halophilus]|uniref:hypothetical protein n=1 Tax=Halosolutus halophilus TaxID=1552990 RepID=UPI002235261F|nr:hypothetical protein [Halosolutus halophilus]